MARNLMIQGTMSNAGKSLITAGILRVLKQDGYKAAPFKSQNMALNSFITEEGLEMGRAQVRQAEAAGIKPEVCMNPILLKPTTDIGSQVIVNGEVLGNFPAKEYFKIKKKLIPDILKAYHFLEERYDIIIIEGAGSPAEINLKTDDIVNMGIAKMVDAPVLLVGDIDRGGVFAQLYGTVALLEEEEKARIKGLIINKFRGDFSLLEPGIAMIKERCQKEVVGVLPYIKLDIEDEDSLSERFFKKKNQAPVTVGIIRFPHISNFTDFNPLEILEEITTEYITSVSDWREFDLIVLPGTKSTITDLLWLRESGLEALIKKAAAYGTLIMGICGGYQMLGEEISDFTMQEGITHARGIGLLPVKTDFQSNKTRTRKKGHILNLSGAWSGLSISEISGYEIHMGETRIYGEYQSFSEVRNLDGTEMKYDGCIRENICGTYLHGIFEGQELVQALVTLLYKKKGISYTKGTFDWKKYKEKQYDKLAEMIRKHMDINKVYQIMGLK